MNLYHIINKQSAVIVAQRKELKTLEMALENSRKSLAAGGPALHKAREARKQAEKDLDAMAEPFSMHVPEMTTKEDFSTFFGQTPHKGKKTQQPNA
ncbi:hypothetical protein [Desulfovibrio cuneatus]|uniref:hypothetical protein n=1 Tax=Desulfovibrio cuneatus TaxID=159728 RepID=UPI0004068AAF|nr:hypothetical protein [Desulfovibrio cuneatus]